MSLSTQAARDFKGTHTDGRTPEELRELVSHVGAELELAPGRGRSSSGPSRPSASASAITSSMGDAVLAHLASTVAPGIDVVFLDTGYHFVETIGTRDAVEATLPVNLRTVSTVADRRRAGRAVRQGPLPDRPRPVLRAAQGQAARRHPRRVRRLGHRPAPRRDPQPGHRAGRRLGRQEGQGQGLAAGALDRRAGRAVHRRPRRAGQPARARRLPLHRLLALHPARRPRRRPAQRPLGRHHQDRVRDPRMRPLPISPAHRHQPTTTASTSTPPPDDGRPL